MSVDNPYATPTPASIRRMSRPLAGAMLFGLAVGLAVQGGTVWLACYEQPGRYNPLTGAGLPGGVAPGFTWHNVVTGLVHGAGFGLVLGSMAAGAAVCCILAARGLRRLTLGR